MADEKKKDIAHGTRAHPRVDSFNRVHVIPQDGTPMDVFSSNVSRGGMFLRSNQPLPTGKKVKLEFETINGTVRVDESEIVWNRPFDPARAENQVSGMGIMFRSMPEESRKKIETFIDEILSTPRTPASPTPKISVPLAPPLNSSPPEQTASTRSLASQPIRSSPRTDIETDSVVDTEPTTVTERAGATNEVDSSKSDFSGPNDFLQTVDERQIDSHNDDALNGEEYMTLLSPPPRKRVFLFAGFVLLVAVVTFFTMLLIRPSVDDSSGVDSAGTTPRTTAQNQTPATNTTDAKKNEPPDAGAVAASTQPAPPPPKTAKAVSNEQPKLANIKETTTDQREVGPPVFEQRPNGWQMVINANRALEIKYFALNAPPRLAIDFHEASFTGKSWTLEAPSPAVAKVRMGKQEWGVRFVLDFQGNEAPTYKINVEPASITVSFSQ
jgi:Tfp pilus assembly protein PilZ